MRVRLCILTLGLPLLCSCHLIYPYEGRGNGDQGVPGSDACLPIPAGQVKGAYAGTWRGVYTCPGNQPWEIQGNLSLSMKPAGGDSGYEVTGEMKGVADKYYHLKGGVVGTLGCRAMQARLDSISVTVYLLGIPITYYMRGSLRGIFSPSLTGQSGFKLGTWTAEDKGSSCSASGSWTATEQ